MDVSGLSPSLQTTLQQHQIDLDNCSTAELQAISTELSPEQMDELNSYLAALSLDSDVTPLEEPESGTTMPSSSTLDGLSDTLNVDIYTVMALMQQMAREQRDEARLGRLGELQAQVQTLMAAAETMRDAADKRASAAIQSAVVQVAFSAVAFTVSAVGLASGFSQITKMREGIAKLQTMEQQLAELTDDVAKEANKAAQSIVSQTLRLMDQVLTQWDKASQLANQLEKMATSIDDATHAAQTKKAAENDDAAVKEEEAEATRRGATRDSEDEWMRNMSDLIRDFQTKLAQMLADQNEAMKKIVNV